MNVLSEFDPLLYLNIKPKHQDKVIFSSRILEHLTEYLVIRFVEILPENNLSNITSTQQLFDLAKEKIPNIEEKTKKFLEDFKEEFKKSYEY